MKAQPYYYAYENRYQKVFAAGGDRWGHSPEDDVLADTLARWVTENGLRGLRVLEFACGEGAGGVLLSRMGCVYHGVDIAPSAVEKTTAALRAYPNASVERLDMVNQPVAGVFDAALDVMGFHMLVLDADRRRYLKNAFNSLKPGSPMLFFRESYRPDAPEDLVETFGQWLALTGDDYVTPLERSVRSGDHEVLIHVPLVPGRGRSRAGYACEMREAGFIVDDIIEMAPNTMCPQSVSVYVHKPY